MKLQLLSLSRFKGWRLIKPPKEYMQRLYDFCQENGIVFAVDEVNQGLGRTGKMWGIDHFDLAPDIMSIGKSLASGMPLSAIVGRKEIMESLEPPAICLPLLVTLFVAPHLWPH